MNYEKKYKEALEKARELMDKGYYVLIPEIFPELKKSEDESIKNEIIAFVVQSIHRCGGTPIPQERENKWIAWLEKQSEKKPTDEVEPKFKVGDFIINDYCLGKVIEITNDAYLLDTGQGIPFSCENTHLWAIEDAKDGDVLVVNNEIFIYAHRKQMYSIAVAHCFVGSAGGFYLDGEFWYEENGKTISPATKKQCDLLFQKMKEAGYEWDSEKKELKKIEVASKESEDERIRKEILNVFNQLDEGTTICGRNYDYAKWIAWLEKQGNKSVNIDVESMVSSYEQRLESQGGTKYTPLVNMCLTAFRHGVKNVLEELNLKKLEKQGDNKECDEEWEVTTGLYKCTKRMFDGSPENRLWFEIGSLYKCVSKDDIAEFESSYGHNVFLIDPVVREHFIKV